MAKDLQFETIDAETGLPIVNAGGGYEGAKKLIRELAQWQPPLQSADAALLRDKDSLDARMQDIERNDGYVHGAMNAHKDSIVGTRFRLNSKPNWKHLGLDETWSREFQSFVENEWMLFAESNDHWLDARRQNTFTGLVRLALGSVFLGGEHLATAEWLRASRRPYKTAIQMVDPTRLSNPQGMMDTPTLRKGVERNRYGEAIRFFIRDALPTDYFEQNQYRWKSVASRKPWGRKQVLHYFDVQRVDQSRGVADLVSALKGTKMASKYKDIVLQNAVLNATYAATIESELPTAEVFASLGMEQPGDLYNTWAANLLECINAYTGNSNNLTLDGVRIPHLYPGTKLNLKNAGQPGGVGTGFEDSLLRYTAAALGMSYEEFSQDFTKTNYSSFRGASEITHKRMMSKKKTVADSFANDCFRLWFEEAFNAGDFRDVLPSNAPDLYGRLNMDAYCQATWIGAARGQIDELKETNAAIARIAAGLSTYETECARFGSDYRDVFAQRLREQMESQEMGLVLDLGAGGRGTLDAGGGAVDEAPKGVRDTAPQPENPDDGEDESDAA